MKKPFSYRNSLETRSVFYTASSLSSQILAPNNWYRYLIVCIAIIVLTFWIYRRISFRCLRASCWRIYPQSWRHCRTWTLADALSAMRVFLFCSPTLEAKIQISKCSTWVATTSSRQVWSMSTSCSLKTWASRHLCYTTTILALRAQPSWLMPWRLTRASAT